jgi:hypothetical protein
MLPAIKLNDQLALVTDKIREIGPDRCLAAKFAAIQLTMADALPKGLLGIRHLLS